MCSDWFRNQINNDWWTNSIIKTVSTLFENCSLLCWKKNDKKNVLFLLIIKHVTIITIMKMYILKIINWLIY